MPHTIRHHPRRALAIQASASLILQTSESDEESALLTCFPSRPFKTNVGLKGVKNLTFLLMPQRREKNSLTIGSTPQLERLLGIATLATAKLQYPADPSGRGGSTAQASLSETLTWSIKEAAVGGRYGEQAVSLATFWRLPSFYACTW